MQRTVTVFTMILITVCCFSITAARANYFDKSLATGNVRVYYSTACPATSDAILLGVGTSMLTSSYGNLANAMANLGHIVVIMDHNPGNMIKTDATKFRNLALDVRTNLVGWLAATNCRAIAHWIMGGHSAGGQAAQNAVAGNPGLADAVFSIDPYNCSETGTVHVPALYWGFNVTTCFVTKEDAAEAAYYGSAGPRAFVRVAKKYVWGPCGYSPKFFHCSFCDGHCPACTNCMTTPSYFFTDLATSVDKFIDAAFYGVWSKTNLTFSATTPLTLFVDGDQP
ncbi:MAG: hypothetical protein ACOZF0_15185 [Thermodesulfobacteriota bacterium]